MWFPRVLFCKAQTGSVEIVPAKKPYTFERLTVIRFSPFHTLDNAFQPAIEAFVDSSYRKSFVFLPTIYWTSTRYRKESGWALEIQFNIYPKGFMQKKPGGDARIGGFYIAPGLAFGSTLLKTYGFNYNEIIPPFRYNGSTQCTWFVAAITFGYQFSIWKTGFVNISAGGGLKLNSMENEAPPSLETLDQYGSPNFYSRNYQGFLPKVNLTVGIRL